MHNAINKTTTEQLLNNTWVNLLFMLGIMSIINGAALALLNFDGDFLTGVFGYLIGDIAGAFFFGDCALHLSFHQVFQLEFRIKIPQIIR